MALEKVKVISQISIDTEKGFVSVRESTRILEDGNQIAPDSYHRYVLSPGTDVSKLEACIQALCAATWTKDILAKYQAAVKAAAESIK